MGRSQGAAIATFLGAVSVGRLQGAATANFLPDVSVGDLQGAAIANFLVDDINPKSIGHQCKMIQNRFKNNEKWLLERTNISAKSIGQQPKPIQNLVRKSFKKQFLEPCWLKSTPSWSHLGPR